MIRSESYTNKSHRLNDETEEDISILFGANDLKIVKECSVDNSLNSVELKQHLLDIVGIMSPQVKLIYLADLYSNVNFLLEYNNKPPGWSNGMITGYVYWCRLMYKSLNGINKDIDVKFVNFFMKIIYGIVSKYILKYLKIDTYQIK